MSYYTTEQLAEIGFKKIGTNCKISTKASIYRPEEIEIGNDCRIDDFVILSGKIHLKNNIHIAAFCNLSAGECSILFEDFSGLAYGCHVFTGSDDYSGRTMTNPTIPLKYKNLKEKNIIIGKHAIIGTNSIIMPGVTIAEGTAVGALSMVTKSTKPWGIYFGNPAKRIKERKKDLLNLEMEYIKEKSKK
ncbi:acyltransferase [Proteus mirabilis]|uniref:VioB n=2 Tax=Proteus mirabilis TaxID=584 RepID=A0A385JM83_PROMI|nr:acyltransferase [Proteus mirabilis]AXY99398.1 vioB [Proteus mirabilis]AXY99695.1 vioB [Proteus mirabilis]EKW1742764.1 acyltransferase [Proteus mirabilis]MBB6688663.1 acyltransferase [Proteus mirabilis]MBG2882990.1 acyltransferase [Proteus mirabilis]